MLLLQRRKGTHVSGGCHKIYESVISVPSAVWLRCRQTLHGKLKHGTVWLRYVRCTGYATVFAGFEQCQPYTDRPYSGLQLDEVHFSVSKP